VNRLAGLNIAATFTADFSRFFCSKCSQEPLAAHPGALNGTRTAIAQQRLAVLTHTKASVTALKMRIARHFCIRNTHAYTSSFR
jgi:hypothetical protein